MRLRGADLHHGWAELLGRYFWDVFVTLTLDPKRWPRRDRALAEREARRWLEYVEWLFRSPIGWVLVAERDRSGAWHVHVLVIGIGHRDWTAPKATWEERCGFIQVKSVWAGQGISDYITKSVERGGEIMLSDTLPRYKRGGGLTLSVNSAGKRS